MSIDRITNALENIKEIADDPERAHVAQDELYKEFVEHVRDRPNDPDLSRKAWLILTVEDIEFSRWYA